MYRADRYLAAVPKSGEVPPLPRTVIAVAAWQSGFRNIRAISQGLGAERNTIYADLRAAGIDPTER